MSVSPHLVFDDVSTCWGSEVSEDVGDLSDDDKENPEEEIDVGDQFEMNSFAAWLIRNFRLQKKSKCMN